MQSPELALDLLNQKLRSWEKIFVNIATNTGLISKMYKQLIQLMNLYGQRNLAGYSPWGGKELDTAKQLSTCSSVL